MKKDPSTLPLPGEGDKNIHSSPWRGERDKNIYSSPWQGGGQEGVIANNTYAKTFSIHNRHAYKIRRKQLRKNLTEPERRLWQMLRNHQLGVKFRRQQGIGDYIADFYCAECKLVIEIDGDSHFTTEGKAYDTIRNQYMQAADLCVLRFTNDQVMKNRQAVVEQLQHYLEQIKISRRLINVES